MKRFLKIPREFFLNRYFLTGAIFLLWVGIFDENNLVERAQLNKELHQLKTDLEFYDAEIEQYRKRLNELKTDNQNLEKFAREQYYMKRDDEDIFIIKKVK